MRMPCHAGPARGRALQTRQPSACSSRHRKRVLTSSTRAARISSPTTTCARAIHHCITHTAWCMMCPVEGLQVCLGSCLGATPFLEMMSAAGCNGTQ